MIVADVAATTESVAAAGDIGKDGAVAGTDATPVGDLGDYGTVAMALRSTLEVVEVGIVVVAGIGEVLVSFSQVHHVVSPTIGSRF